MVKSIVCCSDYRSNNERLKGGVATSYSGHDSDISEERARYALAPGTELMVISSTMGLCCMSTCIHVELHVHVTFSVCVKYNQRTHASLVWPHTQH